MSSKSKFIDQCIEEDENGEVVMQDENEEDDGPNEYDMQDLFIASENEGDEDSEDQKINYKFEMERARRKQERKMRRKEEEENQTNDTKLNLERKLLKKPKLIEDPPKKMLLQTSIVEQDDSDLTNVRVQFRGDPFDGNLHQLVIELANKQYENSKIIFNNQDMETLIQHFEIYWFLKEFSSPMSSDTIFGCLEKRFGGTENVQTPEYKIHIDGVVLQEKECVNLLENVLTTNGLMIEGDERFKDFKERIQKLNKRITSLYYSKLQMWQTVNINAKSQSSVMPLDDVMVNDSKLTEAQKLMRYFSSQCKQQEMRKIDTQLYRQQEWMGNNTHSYVQSCTALEFLYQISSGEGTEPWIWRTKAAGNVDFVLKDFKNNYEKNCPILKRDRNAWSFSNLLWKATFKMGQVSEKMIPYCEDVKFEGDPSLKFIPFPLRDLEDIGPEWTIDAKDGCYYDMSNEKIYDPSRDDISKKPKKRWMDIATPVIDKIMSDQKWPRIVKLWNYVMMGRLSCQVGPTSEGCDNWQINPLFYGKAGTGKSTLARHALSLFNENDVFNLESVGETTFQLENSIGKLVWCILELKKELRLASNRYQTMVSGEAMTIPRKNLVAHECRWTLPGLMVGNDTLPFKDAQGSIARRTVVWEFLKKIQTVDTTLDSKLKEELPNFIRKAVMGYFFTREWVGSKAVWDVLPPYFKQTQSSLRQNVDIVEQFIVKYCTIDNENINYFLPLRVLMKEMNDVLAKEGKSTKDEITEDMLRSALEAKNLLLFCLDKQGCDVLRKKREDYELQGKNADEEQDYVDLVEEVSRTHRSDISLQFEAVKYREQIYKSGEFVSGIMVNQLMDKIGGNRLYKSGEKIDLEEDIMVAGD